MNKNIIYLIASIVLWGTLGTLHVSADSLAHKTGNSLLPFLAVSGVSLLCDSDRGEYKAWRGAQALAVTYTVTEAMKSVFHETRPDGSDDKSFPSGHAALSFTAASVLDISQHDAALPAYTAAGMISWSRVEEDKHYWKDVIIGAVLGYIVGKQYAVRDRSESPLIQLGVSF